MLYTPEEARAIIKQLNLSEKPVIHVLEELIIEPKAADYNKTGGKSFHTFNSSLETLRQRGYERHLRADEVFSLAIAELEGNILKEQKEVLEDIRKTKDEWVSLAVERVGSKLTFFVDPKNLVWANTCAYITRNNKPVECAEKRVFEIQDSAMPKKEDSKYEAFLLDPFDVSDKSIFEFLFSRPFRDIPFEIIERNGLELIMPYIEKQIVPISITTELKLSCAKLDAYSFGSRGVKDIC